MAKEFSKKFYSSKRWQQCRNDYAAHAHYLCENCLAKGIYKPGVIVHHIEELTPLNIDNPEIATGFDNLQMLCRECHREQHKEAMDKWSNRFAKVNEKRKQEAQARKRFKILNDGTVIGRP